MVAVELPKLGKAAAIKAIEEWGQPASRITHLVFCTTANVEMPGADIKLARLLALSPAVKRAMLCNIGCYGGGTTLRLAKDIAENNRGARVLVVCSEMTITGFRGISESSGVDQLVGLALFGDGASAVVVKADPDPDPEAERPLFQLFHARQTFIPGSEDGIVAHLREAGFRFRLSKKVPTLISENIEGILVEALGTVGVIGGDWNSMFWIIHPGGADCGPGEEKKLGLKKERMRATREVLSEYGT